MENKHKNKIEFNYKVVVENISVEGRFYEFYYSIYKNDVKIADNNFYGSDYDNGMSEKEFLQYLKEGYAHSLALEITL